MIILKTTYSKNIILGLITIFLYYKTAHCNDIMLLRCEETTTGTKRSDLFKIIPPEFHWYYKGVWYELSISDTSVAKDWKVSFEVDKIKLFNKPTGWKREVDLKNMTARLDFPTGESYIYKCSKLNE